MNPEIFRTYDIRGIADVDLTNEAVEILGKSYGTFLPSNAKRIGIGRDIRLSSERIKNNFVKGLLSTGLNVIDFSVIPTPLLYFSVHKYGLDGGVVITGSHNPEKYNGLKILVSKDTIYGEEIQEIRRIADKSVFRKGSGSYEERDIEGEYIDDILGRISPGKRKLKIVFDAGNGTTGPVTKRLYSKLSFEFEILFSEPDGSFPNHLPDPTIPEYLQDLIRRVKKSKADIGIGFDGDGDRIGAIDEKGRIIWGDKLLAIYSSELLKKRPGAKIICEVKCSNGLLEYIKELGGVPIMWKTGHSLIKAKMKEEDAPLAGEMSGHMFFSDNYYGFDDAIFASLRLVELVSRTEEPLSMLVDKIPSYFVTPEIRIDCPDSKKFEVVKEVKKVFEKDYKIIDVDGVRVSFSDGWGLLRASNTQPVLVLRFEANSQEALNRIKTRFYQTLEKYDFIRL
ncbi:MAG: phosphomannomutase/phosphoglucomutase [Candidatus Cloacimonadota bacterium]|nr:MAG: phosphomannomutase/phosphoglucomutase [Candidatus Cloacimonadota bacterium]